jgi:hypothetical protein
MRYCRVSGRRGVGRGDGREASGGDESRNEDGNW